MAKEQEKSHGSTVDQRSGRSMGQPDGGPWMGVGLHMPCVGLRELGCLEGFTLASL